MAVSWNAETGARSALDFYRLNAGYSQTKLHDEIIEQLLEPEYTVSFDHFRKRILAGYATSAPVQAAAALVLDKSVGVLFPYARSPAVEAAWSFNTRFWLSQAGSPLRGPDEAPFQNFKLEEVNRSPIESIWTELGGSSLNVSRVDGGKADLGDVLRINYRSSGTTTCSYVGIHPQDRLPRARLNQEWICFQARCVGKSRTTPVIAVRVSDRHHYQWQFAPNELRFQCLKPEAARFTTFHFPLTDRSAWTLLWPPSRPPKSPDFTTINRIAIEFGFGSESVSSSKGSAVVEVKNLCLCSSNAFKPQLKANQKRSDFALSPVPL